ncbi:ATP-binding protein [Pediococcus stilesii]|uniref:DNA replication protein n=1 Tax=Pediococcus stilesii TaxID=331679 RepID=A0A0R2L7M1_9LACO|nr:ATP-binding protein [Pediococcus stilesii]KRN94564.1 DNA replication protein [Pediococcus stilesii]
MEDLSFNLLNQAKAIDEYCKIHPSQKLIKVGNQHEPFCIQCVKEQREQHMNDLVLKGVLSNYHRGFRDVLIKDSIIDDEDLWKADFSNYEVEKGTEAENNLNKARHLAGRYLNRSYTANTVITGNPGVGKSHLAISMLKAVNEHIKPNASCLFVSVNELIRLIKDSFSHPDSQYTESRMVELLGKVNLLVLDDLGSEASFKRESREASEYVQQVLFGVLNKRNRTIITTNLNSDELSKIYNPKLLSRMYKGVMKNDGIIKFKQTKDKRMAIF